MPPTLLFILLLILTFPIAFYFLRTPKTESAVQQHLEEIKSSREDASGGPTILREEGYSTNPGISEIVQLIPGAMGTLHLIRQSGSTWAVSKVMGISLAITVVVSLIVSFFVPGMMIPVAGGIVAGMGP